MIVLSYQTRPTSPPRCVCAACGEDIAKHNRDAHGTWADESADQLRWLFGEHQFCEHLQPIVYPPPAAPVLVVMPPAASVHRRDEPADLPPTDRPEPRLVFLRGNYDRTKYWRTKQGELVLIETLSESHLRNILRMLRILADRWAIAMCRDIPDDQAHEAGPWIDRIASLEPPALLREAPFPKGQAQALLGEWARRGLDPDAWWREPRGAMRVGVLAVPQAFPPEESR
jgi:hypothetical protein